MPTDTDISAELHNLMDSAIAHKNTVVALQRICRMSDTEAKDLMLRRLKRDRDLFLTRVLARRD